ncbi:MULTISPECIES: MarR family winged helix-turn-helix transcriptional regulator [Glutamicibacter]|jgi:DNA-binding MarR family transcriptional regulator|uniref:MarR family transcriptional regulator n=2 Tax=Glutamicibacter arilaitensis TaxID=256701 RepID=A0A2N7S1Q3_9MICC|nr:MULTISPECIES: MarR family transcriptional regulator [Glutamicibacter]CBT76845.1 putative MarR-family transcriptional regulator [Glutamicibacter arilaitensis Re117]PMQ20076.1 MarR family transcriptional regulator [Glutamicibacter arilaitensis]TFH56328.1 MarR family transcriptional regulator [Glutamicibacter arilaitensis]HCH48888.1 MarR family transcriptional regulator [Glutamicibacter sp.]HCJ54352.1 MarR family transcriptional regulator [Glutamicibacter sp.]
MQNDESKPDLADLFLHASRMLRGRWRDSLIPLGITPHQSRVLTLLSRADEVGLRNSQLAEQLHIAARSTTEVVDQLEAKSLVVRTPDPADRRATLIALSPTGRAQLGELAELRRSSMEGYFDKLGTEERAELTRLLGILDRENPRPIRAGCKQPAKDS